MKFDFFISLKDEGYARMKVKRSEFIATARHVSSEDEAKKFVARVSNEYRNATHNCWAYKIGEKEYFSDGGEPTGTAGGPILSSVHVLKLDRVCVVVSRYFGGVKLGVKGLRDAYAQVSKMALENAKHEKYLVGKNVELSVNYQDFDKIVYKFRKAGYFYRVPPEFMQDIKLTVFVPLNEEVDLPSTSCQREEVAIGELKKI